MRAHVRRFVASLLGPGKHHDGARRGVHLEVVRALAPVSVLRVIHLVAVVAVVAAKLGPITVKNHLVLAAPGGTDAVRLVRVGGVEVEDEEEFALLGDNHLIALVLERDILVGLEEEGECLLEPVHGRVEVVEVDVPKQTRSISVKKFTSRAVKLTCTRISQRPITWERDAST